MQGIPGILSFLEIWMKYYDQLLEDLVLRLWKHLKFDWPERVRTLDFITSSWGFKLKPLPLYLHPYIY